MHLELLSVSLSGYWLFLGASSRLWPSYQFCFLKPRYPPLPEFPWYRGKSSRTELFFQLSYFEFLIFIADTSVWTQLIHLQEGFLNFLCLCWPNHEIRLPVNRIIIFFIKQLACTERIAYIPFSSYKNPIFEFKNSDWNFWRILTICNTLKFSLIKWNIPRWIKTLWYWTWSFHMNLYAFIAAPTSTVMFKCGILACSDNFISSSRYWPIASKSGT